MRCNNCGWENQDTAATCIKCNTRLETMTTDPKLPSQDNSQFGKTITDSQLPVTKDNEPVFEKTIPEGHFKPSNRNVLEEDVLIPCGHCGYLNSGEAKVCARCKTALSVLHPTDPISSKPYDTKGPTTSEVSTQAEDIPPSFATTIDPFRRKTDAHACTLTPVLRERENQDRLDITTGNPRFSAKNFVYDKNPVELKRDNLDENNNTITSKVQAELTFENGKWYLLDRSELNTSFIQAKRKMELREGDIVLMGDRKFIFSETDKSKWTE